MRDNLLKFIMVGIITIFGACQIISVYAVTVISKPTYDAHSTANNRNFSTLNSRFINRSAHVQSQISSLWARPNGEVSFDNLTGFARKSALASYSTHVSLSYAPNYMLSSHTSLTTSAHGGIVSNTRFNNYTAYVASTYVPNYMLSSHTSLTTSAHGGLVSSAKFTNNSTYTASHIRALVDPHPAPGNTWNAMYNNKGVISGASFVNFTGGNVMIGVNNYKLSPLPATSIVGAQSSGASAQFLVHRQYSSTATSGGGGVLLYHNQNNNKPPIKDNRLGYFLFGGLKSNLQAINGAGVFAYADENWSDTAGGSRFQFETVQNGTTTRLERLRISGNGNVGIGTTTPSTLLQVGTGFNVYTASRLKLASSAMPEPTLEGVIWKNGHTFYGNQYQVTRSFNMAHGIVTANTTVANTTTETTVYTAAQAANYPTAGKTIRINLNGFLSKRASADTLTVRLKTAGTTILTSTFNPGVPALTQVPFHMRFIYTYRTIGSSGTCISAADMDVNNTSLDAVATTTTTVNTTVTNDITVTLQWSVADASNTATVTLGHTDTIGALELRETQYARHYDTLGRREETA